MALDLAAAGWTVAVHYTRSEAEARAVADEISANGFKAATVQADLAVEEEAAGLIDWATAKIGPLGCLVNNASVFEKDTPQTVTKESWETHMQVNLRAPFQLTQAFAAALPDGVEGNVINLIDQRVWNVTLYFTSYTAVSISAGRRESRKDNSPSELKLKKNKAQKRPSTRAGSDRQ